MYCLRYGLLIILTLTTLSETALGQKGKEISLDLINVRFEQFVVAIEAQTNYHFYYDSVQMDTFRVSIRADRQTLDVILSAVFGPEDFHYGIDRQMHVFVFRKYELQTSLFIDSGTDGKEKTDGGPAQNATLAEIREQKKANIRSPLENKIFDIGRKQDFQTGNHATVAGYVRDLRNGEPIIGASVLDEGQKAGVSTDQYGYYALTLTTGRHVLKISSIGMTDTRRQVMIYTDGKLDIELLDYVPLLKAVIVSAEKTTNIRSAQMGTMKLNIATIRQMPALFGEADILRVVLTMPGVTSVGEATTGFNVRGGAADQNLILFNDATIYNPSHFFGFFSAFNPEIVRSVELYKSSIPEKYGGRLASVLDVISIEGNKNKMEGKGSIGPMTAGLVLQGPIDSGKTSFVVGARTTYSDWVLRAVPNKYYNNSSATFYDLNLQVSHTINAKNSLFLTGYYSEDHFRLNSDTLYSYNNANANLKWKHIFNNRFNAVFTGGYDSYRYGESSSQKSLNGYDFTFNIQQVFGRADLTYVLNEKHVLDFGLSSIYYRLNPGDLEPYGGQSIVIPNVVSPETALESALYIGDHFTITPKLSLNAGVRYSFFSYFGPQTIRIYAPGQPREMVSVTDSINYSGGETVKSYRGPEFRISARYILSENSSVKASYNTLRQYIHTLSNTSAIAPTDIWKLSDPYVQPQWGEQYSLGFYRNFKANTIETSIEVYYKKMLDYLDYKSGAVLVLNHHIETDVVNSEGKAYGAEFLIRKSNGKLNGWISYTYSRTFLKTNDALANPPVNNGQYYPADYDKPSNLNVIANYQFSHRFSISLFMNYSTGRPITLPIAEFNLGGADRVFYANRNQYRIPDYFRADFSVNIDGNHVKKQKIHNSWTFGVYNITGRENPYNVYFTSENGHVKGYQLSIFGTAMPFITYNFRF
jgi:hypothetical protein